MKNDKSVNEKELHGPSFQPCEEIKLFPKTLPKTLPKNCSFL